MVVNVANKLIDFIKGNCTTVDNETEVEALERLSKAFFDATKKASRVKINAALSEQAPRMEEEAPTPRGGVNPATLPRVQTAIMSKVPNLISTDDSDDKYSDDELHNDKDDEESIKTPQTYIT